MNSIALHLTTDIEYGPGDLATVPWKCDVAPAPSCAPPSPQRSSGRSTNRHSFSYAASNADILLPERPFRRMKPGTAAFKASNSCIFPPGLVFFRHPGTVIPRLIHFFVPVHCRGERLPPSVSRVDVVGSQDRPLAVTAVVEAEERVIAGGGKVAVTGGALLTAVDGGPEPWGQQTPKSSAPLSSPWNTQ